MAVRTKRWNDAREPDDGFRLLVSRFRPRGVGKGEETWDEWWPDLGPSRALHAAFYGKEGASPLPFAQYVPRFMEQMRAPAATFRIRALADRAAAGESITLLCSSACTDPARCHRTLLASMIEAVNARRRGA